jgi:GNAT superfamily N-acetyltransferase
MPLEVRPAGPDDVEAVADVLAEETAWLQAKGIRQWPARFPADFLLACAGRGELYAGTVDDRIVATVTLQWSDPSFWGDRQDAGFVHRLAVRRSHAGCGPVLLKWAEQEVRRRGRSFLCLDTLSSNIRLCRYYEKIGFRAVGEIAGPADHLTDPALGSWRATLYEKAIPKPEV